MNESLLESEKEYVKNIVSGLSEKEIKFCLSNIIFFKGILIMGLMQKTFLINVFLVILTAIAFSYSIPLFIITAPTIIMLSYKSYEREVVRAELIVKEFINLNAINI